MYSRIQKHTVEIYNLKSYEYQIEEIPARDLLLPQRFDLFAKLFYIRNLEQNRELALKVYVEHIRAFNPDFCEPGRDDKVSLDDFVSTFDGLISFFKDNEFDSTISLIPTAEDYTILDGAHRVAALAYWNRTVKIVRFKGVRAKGAFDYNYFKSRGLSSAIADLIASEIPYWKENLYVACLWPRMGNSKEKEKAIGVIETFSSPFYIKKVSVSIQTMVKLIANVYSHQDWVGDEKNGFLGAKDKARRCFASNKNINFVLFAADDLTQVLDIKDQIRRLFIFEKDSIHITDNSEESFQLCQLVLSDDERSLLHSSDNFFMLLQDRIGECWFYVKNILWLNIKIELAKILNKLGLRK